MKFKKETGLGHKAVVEHLLSMHKVDSNYTVSKNKIKWKNAMEVRSDGKIKAK